jgi:hypothetical protein
LRKPKPEIPAPDISYIVSAYDRPDMLPIILWALKVQTHRNFEVIVTDNSIVPAVTAAHRKVVAQLEDSRFSHLHTAHKIEVRECYWSAEYAAKRAHGQWLCFPCDDTYLVPEFGQRMLAAGYLNGWDMVICGDIVVGPLCNGHIGYKPWRMEPHRASKTTYIVRASAFPGFNAKPVVAGASLADYHLSGEVPNVGVLRDQLMVVHN